MNRASIGRYALLDEISSPALDPAVSFWRGHDEILDREVSVRVLDADDPRAPAFLGAARAAALVEDRRLLRILDILTLPAEGEEPAVVAVVSEWARGQSLAQLLQARDHVPLPAQEAVAIIDDVARAIAAGLATKVSHGRLRPSSVIVTDAGEVRVRGLAVDAALWGQLDPALLKDQADVDGLGSLLYLLVTGTWPTAQAFTQQPSAPRTGDSVLPPSHIRADIPRSIDDCVARSVQAAARPRGVRNVADADGFVAMLGVTRDHVVPPGAGPTVHHQRGGLAGRLLAAAAALAIAVGLGVVGWQLVAGGPDAWEPSADPVSDSVLTVPAVPAVDEAGIERRLTIESVRSFDPRGDDNGNGKPDGRKGRENDADAPLAADADTATGWESGTYRSGDLDGKGGVGLVLDLGSTHAVREVDLTFAEAGTPVEVRVADRMYKDPGTWPLLTSAGSGATEIALRAPRPLQGRYVLVWFPGAPRLPGSWSNYQVAVNEIDVLG